MQNTGLTEYAQKYVIQRSERVLQNLYGSIHKWCSGKARWTKTQLALSAFGMIVFFLDMILMLGSGIVVVGFLMSVILGPSAPPLWLFLLAIPTLVGGGFVFNYLDEMGTKTEKDWNQQARDRAGYTVGIQNFWAYEHTYLKKFETGWQELDQLAKDSFGSYYPKVHEILKEAKKHHLKYAQCVVYDKDELQPEEVRKQLSELFQTLDKGKWEIQEKIAELQKLLGISNSGLLAMSS